MMLTSFYTVVERELRQRNYKPETVGTYLNNVRAFTEYFHPCHPRELKGTDVKSYLLYLQATKSLPSSAVHESFRALQFLYDELYKSPLRFHKIPSLKKKRSHRPQTPKMK